jgi:hypothetical protein
MVVKLTGVTQITKRPVWAFYGSRGKYILYCKNGEVRV